MFLKNSFKNTNRVSNNLDSGRSDSVGPDLSGSLGYQQTTLVDKEFKYESTCESFIYLWILPLKMGWLHVRVP